jgi:hypothetical protein
MTWGKTKSKHNTRQSLDEKSKPKPSAFSWVPKGFYFGKNVSQIYMNWLVYMN